MRILVALAVVIVFVAMWMFDTAALLRLTAICFTGGCGVPPVWIALGAGSLAVVIFVSCRTDHYRPKRKASKASSRRRPKTGTTPRTTAKSQRKSQPAIRPKPAK
jgi:hypothetical protein